MSAGPWLTRPFRGLIGRFGIAFMIPVLEATLLITLLVRKDTNCVVPPLVPGVVFEEPGGCTNANNQTMNIAGGGVTITNVVGSMTTRVADAVLYTRAGPEIGVASTARNWNTVMRIAKRPT